MMEEYITTIKPSYEETQENISIIFRQEMLKAHILTIPLGIIILYIAGSLTAYLVLQRKNNTADKEQKATAMVLMSIFMALAAFLRVGIDFRLIYGRHDDFGCNFSIKFKTVAYAASLSTFYLILWLRQRIFYRDPRLKHLSSKFMRTVSWSVSILLVTSVFSGVGVFVFGAQYEALAAGCRNIPNRFSNIRWIILGIGTVLFQVGFLGLFIYPLVKHQQSMTSVRNSSEGRNPVIILIKRSVVIASVSVVAEITSTIAALLAESFGSLSNEQTILNIIYELNLTINTVCLIFAFSDWRERLMPWRLRKPEVATDQSQTVENGIEEVSTITSHA